MNHARICFATCVVSGGDKQGFGEQLQIGEEGGLDGFVGREFTKQGIFAAAFRQKINRNRARLGVRQPILLYPGPFVGVQFDRLI